MTTVNSLREQRRLDRIGSLRDQARDLLLDPGQQVWLFGSWARGDWDARSDVDLLAVAPDQVAAEALADALREARVGDDVMALSQERWRQRRCGQDPWWRGIGRDAILLTGGASA
jgi:predicted nucleotidyltransferase